jgi:hypothetical protein
MLVKRHNLISKYFDHSAPGKGTVARRLIAGQLRTARNQLGRKKVRGQLVGTIKKDIKKAKAGVKPAVDPDKLRRLHRTSHKMVISPAIKAKKRAPAAMKPKATVAGAGGRLRSKRAAGALKTTSVTAGRSTRSNRAFPTKSYM